MPTDCYSDHIESVDINSGSSSEGDGQPLANGDQGDDISNQLQVLLDIHAQLSEELDSSEGEPIITENQHLVALFRQRKSGMDNDNILQALSQVVLNSGHKGNSGDNSPQESSEEDTLDSVRTPTEENHMSLC